jgi:phenylalanyl-tRNA synthetase beta chain
LVKTFPSTNTVAQPLGINQLGDIVRTECAMNSWVEALPLILVRSFAAAAALRAQASPLTDPPRTDYQCAREENFTFLTESTTARRPSNSRTPKRSNTKTPRTSLLPGLLKTIRENRKHALPLRIFELSDVAFKDPTAERRACNERRVGAVFCGCKFGFEIVRGLIDRLMLVLDVKHSKASSRPMRAPTLRPPMVSCLNARVIYMNAPQCVPLNAAFFPDRAAKIFYRPPASSSEEDNNDAHVVDVAFASKEEGSAPLPNTIPEPSFKDKPAGDAAAASSATTATATGTVLDNLKDTLGKALPSLMTMAAGGSKQKAIQIGELGILHPTVLQQFELDYPCSTL